MMPARGGPERGQPGKREKIMDYATLMAVRLEAAGAQIKEVTECEPRVDGGVFITDSVSVQVASDGSCASVTKEENGTFTSGQERAQDDILALLADIKAAIQ